MCRDNSPFNDQALQITTEKLTIRIISQKHGFDALCYFTLSPSYNEADVFQVTETCKLSGKILSFPLFSIPFNENNVPFEVWPDYLDYYLEAIPALLDAIKWKEYWIR